MISIGPAPRLDLSPAAVVFLLAMLSLLAPIEARAQTLTLSVSPTTMGEAAGTLTVTVTADSAFPANQDIILTTSGTAISGEDFTWGLPSIGGTVTLVLNAGELSAEVTITATEDNIYETNESFQIRGTHGGVSIGMHTVTIADNDLPPDLTLSASPATMAENGGTSTLEVNTGTGSVYAGDQTITLTLGGTATEDTDYTIVSKSLTLPARATSVTTMITAVEDTIFERDETVEVTGAVGGTTFGSRTVTITDNDPAPELSLSVSPATMAENGGTSTVTVSTGSGQTFVNDETITLTLSGTATENTDYYIGSKSLTLPAGATSVTTTITAVEDNFDEANETVTVRGALEIDGMSFGSPQTVTIVDNDSAPVLRLVVSDATIAEAAGTSRVTVRTGSGSTYGSDRTITLTLGGTATPTADYTIVSKSLTLRAGGSSVTTTLTAVDDNIDETDETVTVSGAVGGRAFGTPQMVTIRDDDTAGVTLGTTTLTVIEGATATYTVVLDTEPAADVTVTVTKVPGGDTDLTASPAALTFTTSSWNTPQTVTISAAEDTDIVAGTATFTHSAASTDKNYDDITIASVTATEVDNDTAGVAVSPAAGLKTTEAGGTATFMVVLTTEPEAEVTIGVTSNDTTEGRVSPASLTFTTSSWSTAQMVTVMGVDDEVADGDQVYTVRLTAAQSTDSGYAVLAPVDVSVTNTDDDEAGVTLGATALTVIEGATATYTVVLDTRPAADVTVTVTKVPGGDANLMASPAALTFTTSSWNTPQTVTISAAEDTDIVAGAATFTHSAASTDTSYDGITIASVTATEADNDTAGVAVSPTAGLKTTEAGGTAAFTVVLTTEPEAEVTIGVTSNDTTEGMVSPASLTFTPSNWSAAQTVTVTGVDDEVADGDRVYTVALAAAQSTDPGYDGLDPADVLVTNTDDDEAGVTLGATALTVIEGATATYTMVLDTRPAAAVTVTVTKVAGGDADLTASPVSLTFTTSNWSTAQTVTVRAAQDDDARHGTAIFTHSAASPDTSYDGIAIASVIATEADINLPAAPANLAGAQTEAGTVTLTWTDPGDTSILKYQYRHNNNGGTSWTPNWTDIAASDAATTTHQVTGLAAGTTYTFEVRAVNAAGAGPAARVEVTLTRDIVAERINRVNDMVLPRVGRAMLASTLGAVTGRIEHAATEGLAVGELGLAGSPTLYQALKANERAIEEGTFDIGRALTDASFTLPLHATEDGEAGPFGTMAFWGNGDWRNLSWSDASASAYEGEVSSIHLGVDMRIGDDVLTGLALSWSRGAIDYTDRGDGDAVSGSHESSLTSVTPYVSWNALGGISFWGTLGYGRGEVEIDDEGADPQSSHMAQVAAAAGAKGTVYESRVLFDGGVTELNLKSQVSFARIDLEGAGLLEPSTFDLNQVRFALEGSHTQRLAAGGTLDGAAELVVRRDGGDGETGVGTGLGASLRYRNPETGITVEARGRALLADDDYEEWGIGGLVHLDPGAAGRGPSLSLVPTWGDTRIDVEGLWEQDVADLASNHDPEPSDAEARIEVTLGYGFGVLDSTAVLTPYTVLSLSSDSARSLSLGGRLEVAPSLELSLEGERREAVDGDADYNVTLRGRLRF